MPDILTFPAPTAAAADADRRPARRAGHGVRSTPTSPPTYELRMTVPGWSGNTLATYVVTDRGGEIVGMLQLTPQLQTAAFRKGLLRALRRAAEAAAPPAPPLRLE